MKPNKTLEFWHLQILIAIEALPPCNIGVQCPCWFQEGHHFCLMQLKYEELHGMSWERGVRQGDPLSPFNTLSIKLTLKEFFHSLLRLILATNSLSYNMDTILIMKASQREIFCLKGLLQSFAESTGLKVNYAKSQMIPLNLSQDQINILANTFGCQIVTLPFTYLGLPLGQGSKKH